MLYHSLILLGKTFKYCKQCIKLYLTINVFLLATTNAAERAAHSTHQIFQIIVTESEAHTIEEALVMLANKVISTEDKMMLNKKGAGFLVPRYDSLVITYCRTHPHPADLWLS